MSNEIFVGGPHGLKSLVQSPKFFVPFLCRQRVRKNLNLRLWTLDCSFLPTPNTRLRTAALAPVFPLEINGMRRLAALFSALYASNMIARAEGSHRGALRSELTGGYTRGGCYQKAGGNRFLRPFLLIGRPRVCAASSKYRSGRECLRVRPASGCAQDHAMKSGC